MWITFLADVFFAVLRGFLEIFCAGFAGFRLRPLAAFLRADLAFAALAASGVKMVSVTSSSSSRQPWASRTEINARKMSFQVFCFIMTALGNMQPSQQM